ncbi:MAG: TIR domain-containing protein [Bacteroidales bacterium]|nr:TIR domain-containing protein [Bacteroidales bacterium]
MAGYDIFLSYRRHESDGTSNVDLARSFYYAFKEKRFKVFFDFNDCTDDFFSQKILPAIRTCDFFVLLLTKDTLVRCKAEGDWVRREIEEALKYNRKIIPITPDGAVSVWPEDLPSSLKVLSANGGIQISSVHRDYTFKANVGLVVRQRMRRKWWRNNAVWGSAAAVVAVGLLLLFLVPRGGGEALVTDSVQPDSIVIDTPAAPQVESVAAPEPPTKTKKKVEKEKTATKQKTETKADEKPQKAVETTSKVETHEVAPKVEASIPQTGAEPAKQPEEVKTDEPVKTAPVAKTAEKPKVNKDYSKAVNFHKAGRYPEALSLFEKLKREGFTGGDIDTYIADCKNHLK